MEKNISRGIGNKLGFLKLTRSGKIRLMVFKEKILYKALSLLQRMYLETPENPFNVYFSLCLLEGNRLNLQPEWNNMGKYRGFSDNNDVTFEGEKFDMPLCHKIMADFKKRKVSSRPTISTKKKDYSKHKLTFTSGIKYWKYGKWYAYPDQAIDENSRPTQEDENWTPRLDASDPSRLNINPSEEFKDAIKSGMMNKKALLFLRPLFRDNLEIRQIIDAYIES